MEREMNLVLTEFSSRVAGNYAGEIVISDVEEPEQILVQVEPLSDVLVRVRFEANNEKVELRAILSEDEEDIHMIIQEKVTDDFILNGVKGFLCKKPNVHGGYISKLDGFYFHILFNHFNGKYREYYFFGIPTGKQAVAV